jgi:hypothetical protein
MGVVLDPNEIVYPPKASALRIMAEVRTFSEEVTPMVTAQVNEAHRAMRVNRDERPLYWAGVDWRNRLGNVLEPFAKPRERNCAGFAVAGALRANLAVHGAGERVGDPGQLNPYFILGLAREDHPLLRDGRRRMLHSALSVVNLYGAPPLGVGPQGIKEIETPFRAQAPRYFDAAKRNKIQSHVDLGGFLGDWSAWLRLMGPIIVQMNIDQELFDFDHVTREKPLIGYRPGLMAKNGRSDKYAGHCVVVVGYIPDEPEQPELMRDTFVVMNSFGPEWGDRGFGYIKVDTAKKCFIDGYGLIFREHLGYTFQAKHRNLEPQLRQV